MPFTLLFLMHPRILDEKSTASCSETQKKLIRTEVQSKCVIIVLFKRFKFTSKNQSSLKILRKFTIKNFGGRGENRKEPCIHACRLIIPKTRRIQGSCIEKICKTSKQFTKSSKHIHALREKFQVV